MLEIDAGGGLVHLLPSPSRRPDEPLLNILLMNSKGLHPLSEVLLLLLTYGKPDHHPFLFSSESSRALEGPDASKIFLPSAKLTRKGILCVCLNRNSI